MFVTTTEDLAMAAALRVEVESWSRELDALMLRVGRWFARPETRRTARDAVDGLLADLPRKNCWSLAEYAGHGSPDRLQHLLARATWDDAAVRAEIAGYVAENLTAGVDTDLMTLVFDETGDQKKGSCTIGVQRQYSGTCGRIENCQLAVYATLATPAGHAFVDVELYLPQSWTGDRDRLAAAGVPAGVEFATKPQLALRMTDRVLAAGVRFGWVAADEAYGDNPGLRRELEARGLNYVMAVSCNTQIPTPAGKLRGRQLRRSDPTRRLADPVRRPRQQRRTALRLGLHQHQRQRAGTSPPAAVPAQSAHRRAGLLPLPRHHHCPAGNAGAGGRNPLADRGEHPSRQRLRRPGRAPSPHLDLLAPLDHPRDARSRLPGRHRRPTTRNTRQPSHADHQRQADSPYLQRNPTPPRSHHPTSPRTSTHLPLEPIPPTPPTPNPTLPLPTTTRSRSTAVVLVDQGRVTAKFLLFLRTYGPRRPRRRPVQPCRVNWLFAVEGVAHDAGWSARR